METLIKTREKGNDDMHEETSHGLDKTEVEDALMKNKLTKIVSPNANEAHSEEEDDELEK